jgi:Tfp pilus assembly protein PilF
MTVGRLLRSGKVDDAVAQAEMAVTLDPGSLNAREALAGAYAARHQPDDAAREFQAAMHLYGTVPAEFASTVSQPVNPLVSPQP